MSDQQKDSAKKFVQDSREAAASDLRRLITAAENKQMELQQIQQQIRGLEQQIQRCDEILKGE